MQDFPSNSQKAARSQVDPPKVEQVTTATTKRRKSKLGSRFKDAFIGGSARDATEYVIAEVIIPAVQNTLIEAFQGGIERMIRGESRPRRGTPSPYANMSRISYNQISQQSAPPATRSLSRQARARHNFDDIVIPSRAEAMEVIERMYDVLSHSGDVRVGTLYELTGIQPSHNDYKWGWRDLHGAKPVRLGDKYLLDLPTPEAL